MSHEMFRKKAESAIAGDATTHCKEKKAV